MLASLDRSLGFEIINLGESRTVELKTLVALIENAVGRQAVVRRRPPQPGDVPVTYADITKARRLLDYHPQVNIEDGIQSFVSWFMSLSSE